ncbi:hypothetical protein [Sulfurovum mangrovi]|uniref:hypothetical protein n=1 Tax=Sulfurovum mangrovi TaxID=2893889 RepID=UPI001E5DCFB8|nr:hypothetical protein [Sulfurovum mangrovi]UFH59843.1 hypothetical protein LN246_03120 [Sulfurovum mangrovi]UFH59894.1 hypothetical protein LN246_03380 [Sulfurovum mangrovi]
MRKEIVKTEFRRINTNKLRFLIQNLSGDDVLIVVTDTDVQPEADAKYDFRIHPLNGISDKDIEGYVWAMTVTFESAEMGLWEPAS